MKIAEIEEKLIQRLSPKRFLHTQGVKEAAVILAQKFGASQEKAALAGVLHDLAREIPEDKLLQMSYSSNIAVTEIDKAMPVLLHAPVGAALAKKEFNVTDSEILQAIARHTVGSTKMGILDKIIYLADFIEPGRDCEGVNQLRELVFSAGQGHQAGKILDQALLAAYDSSIRYNVEKKALLHPATIYGRNDLLLQRQK